MNNILFVKVGWLPYYRGEEQTDSFFSTLFLNIEGNYYTYIDGICNTNKIDYIIFTAMNSKNQEVIVGWYKEPEILLEKDNYTIYLQPYNVLVKDENAILLPVTERNYITHYSEDLTYTSLERRLSLQLKTNKRINYHHSDLNKTTSVVLKDVPKTCSIIERNMMENNYLNALYITNKAILSFGKLASLIYYKAWILYSFLQYKQALFLLNQIKVIPEFADFANYMIGNILFQTSDYSGSINAFLQVKQHELDQCYYMISQGYAMLEKIDEAKSYIVKALDIKPSEPAYISYQAELGGWSNE